MRRFTSLLLFIPAVIALSTARGAELPTPLEPEIASASNEGELAIKRFQVPAGHRLSLVAAEPQLANPVAFTIDQRGRFLICETFRQQKGVEDNRSHMDWLHDDLSLQTVEQRREMFHKHLGQDVQLYSQYDDRIRLLTDTDGDGRVDQASVLASGFNDVVAGTGAGVLSWRGHVYYTCIPDLWLLRDEDQDGQAEQRTSLHTGFGVRVAFRGHDMHGLVMGPDGRIYFSIGDRGFNVTTPENKHLVRPDTGAVFRCLPDGSQLEEFAYGLRNPQELAFDNHGNLFTGDNNSDSGDQARWVYVVRGSDTGWRMYYQYLKDRGPFNREKIWHPQHPQQPAYIVPPIANLADGPSGLTYYPGVGLSDRYENHFFMCDFRGDASNSGIRSFSVEPDGAFFKLTDSHQFLWQVLATDVDFGYDGQMYLTDWVQGWDGPGKGRLYRLTHAASQEKVAEAGVAAMMAQGFDRHPVSQLVTLLSHADRRVRQEAQFTLVDRKLADALTGVAANSDHELARLHAVWGLGQLARQGVQETDAVLLELAADNAAPDTVREQALSVIADAISTARQFAPHELRRWQPAASLLTGLVADADPRIAYFACQAIGQLGTPQALQPLLNRLDQNENRDVILRHGAVMGLVGIGRENLDVLLTGLKHTGAPGRLGVALALRRLQRPEIAQLLRDGEPSIVLAAARAINDEPIAGGWEALAALADQPDLEPPLLRRVLNANYRLGQAEHARRVTAIAANAAIDENLRLEALEELKTWTRPEPLDRVLGAWRPIAPRELPELAEILRPALGGLLSGSNRVRSVAAEIAARYGIKQVGPTLAKLVQDSELNASVRIEALKALQQLEFEDLKPLTVAAVESDVAELRAEARNVLAAVDPRSAVELLQAALQSGQTLEKQQAIATLATIDLPAAERELLEWVERLAAGKVQPEIQLDLINAAQTRKSEPFQGALKKFELSRDPADHLSRFREALAGGDAQRGYEVFFGRSAASCRRCHLIAGNGGKVGPDLSKIGKEKKREYILEAIVDPNRQIAKGFETVILAMDDGKVHAGIVKNETDDTLSLMQSDGAVIVVRKDEIDDQAKGQSGMPADLIKHLTKSDIRDLVEFLVQQDGTAKSSVKHGGENE